MPTNTTVPDTNTFTLQNVVDAIDPTTDDLSDCFNDADSAQFDPTYEGSKDNLYNFRNYGNQSTGTGVLTLSGDNVVNGSYKSLPGGNLGYKSATQKSTSGSGTGFEADIYVDALTINGLTQYIWNGSYQNVTPGSGYAVGDTITFEIANMPSADIVIDAEGEVATIG